MRLEGSTQFNAPIQKVWAFMTDPQKVSPCLPGIKSVEEIEPNKKFKVTGGVSLGSVQVVGIGEGELLEADAPNHIKVKGHGTAPGSTVDVSGEAFFSSTPNGGTELKWVADVLVSGTIASLASRLMGSVTKKLSESFFACVRGKIEA